MTGGWRRWERWERGKRILLNFMMFGIDFAAIGLCVCGRAGGNWSYFLLILGNAWHSRGRGVHNCISLKNKNISQHTKETKDIFSRFCSLSSQIYLSWDFWFSFCLYWMLCEHSQPSVSVFRMMETRAGSPESPPGHWVTPRPIG